ncbi:molybdopterin-containing oxidoreductase family protein [Deferrisoma camini]|uniref:molybdopterin-containing oxidoreductase family protein n=1 Tax=Deferrisoma camini TaxID=1035120 RepID=UPI00046CEA5F|nr:molybdopterin-dependent oxidoreductase [Deferrisoma camini]
MNRWDRRSFLKLGVAGAAGAALPAGAGLRPVEAPHRTLRKFRNPKPSLCGMCPARCGLIAFRDGDRVVQIEGNPGSPTNEGGLCARAFAELERLYDPERVLRPLRRVGPRGSGRWEPVSWDEALGRIAQAVGGRSVLHLSMDRFLVGDLQETLGWTDVLLDRDLPGRPGPRSDADLYGAPVLGPDLRRAETIYLVGAPLMDGRFRVPEVRSLVEARARGARVVLLAEAVGATGSVCEWVPVPPGASAWAALGMAKLLWDEGGVDREALRKSAPTVADALDEALAPYDAGRVAERTGITPERLRRLAMTFAGRRPSVAVAQPGTPEAAAAAVLNHLVGNVNRPGGIQTARGPYFSTPARPTRTPEEWWRSFLEGADAPLDLYLAAEANPAYDGPDPNAVSRALADPERVKLVVAVDTHLTETASMADLVLPLATAYECWDLVEGALPDGRPYLALQQPVTRPASEPDKLRDPTTEHLALFEPWPRPLGEARGIPDLILELARRAGERGLPPTVPAVLDERLRKSWGPGSFQALRRRGIWVAEEPKAPNPVQPPSLGRRLEAPAAEEGLLGRVTAPNVLPRTYANTRRNREIVPVGEVQVAAGAAERLGLRTGDTAVVRSGERHARFPVRVLRGLHPRAVVLPDGFGHRAGGKAATGQDPKVWWRHAGPGASARGVMPADGEPHPVELEPGEG